MNARDALIAALHLGHYGPETLGPFIDHTLAKLAEAGYVVVPRVATDAMHDAARDWSYRKYGQPIGKDASTGCWDAMIAEATKP